MNTTLTRGEAFQTIQFAIENFINGIELNESTVEEITYAVNNDLQIRDYLIGMSADYGTAESMDFIGYLASKTNHSDCYAYDTITALYLIEQNNTISAENLLAGALDSNPNYNLTKLAKRIISAGWNGEAITRMREELHGTVIDTIKEDSDYVIVEVK